MSAIRKQLTNTVPVGNTPVPKYATWDEHSDALHQEAQARRTTMGRRRVTTATNQRFSG